MRRHIVFCMVLARASQLHPKPFPFLPKHAVDNGIVAWKSLPYHAFFAKAEITEERPDGLVLGLGSCRQSAAPHLIEHITENHSQRSTVTPSGGSACHAHFDQPWIGWRMPVVEDHSSDRLIVVFDKSYR
jgi:hypothetical protein